jgi:hypothetical protein
VNEINRKIIGIYVVFMLVAMLTTPFVGTAMAKTRTQIYVIQAGGISVPSAEKTLETPNGRMHFLWGVDGTGSGLGCTLYESDKVTIIDTFVTSSEIDIRAKESTTLGFGNGKLVLHLKMLWESNTHEDSGFAGVGQWRAADQTPHVVTMSAVYHGYGYYEGQLLQLDGTREIIVPGTPPVWAQVYKGTLLS